MTAETLTPTDERAFSSRRATSPSTRDDGRASVLSCPRTRNTRMGADRYAPASPNAAETSRQFPL